MGHSILPLASNFLPLEGRDEGAEGSRVSFVQKKMHSH